MPQTLPTVSELISRARQHDAEALDQLFARCRPYLGLVARTRVESWLKAKADASDLVQQTMMEAYRGFDRFAGQTEAEWLGWLRRILENNAADFIRRFHGAKRQIGKELPLAAPAGDSRSAVCCEPASPDDTPSQALVKLENELHLAAAIEQLAPDYRDVIALRNLQRLPFVEVAHRMNRSRPAVQMLWMRAIQRLQEIIQQDA